MPINELEQHPFIGYQNNYDYNVKDITGIIVGSFPIYSITNSINANREIVLQRDNEQETFMKFFYGSKKSDLWNYLVSIYNFHDFVNMVDIGRVEKVEYAKRLLFENKLIMTDCIKASNRIRFSSADSDLLINTADVEDWVIDNLEYNLDLIDLLETHKNIKNIYFTSIMEIGNAPYSLFKRILFDSEFIEVQHYFPNGKNWAKIIEIDGREYRAFFLPTPKARSIHFSANNQHPLFNNYLQSIDPNLVAGIQFPLNPLVNQQISLHRSNFLIEMYRQAFVNQNLEFNGSI